MECALKILELMPMGSGKGIMPQKLAVKLPAGGADGTEGVAFSEIMFLLTQLTPDQLARLDWVSMQGQSNEILPMIDLSRAVDQKRGLVDLLLGDADQALEMPSEHKLEAGQGASTAAPDLSDGAQPGIGDVSPIPTGPALDVATQSVSMRPEHETRHRAQTTPSSDHRFAGPAFATPAEKSGKNLADAALPPQASGEPKGAGEEHTFKVNRLSSHGDGAELKPMPEQGQAQANDRRQALSDASAEKVASAKNTTAEGAASLFPKDHRQAGDKPIYAANTGINDDHRPVRAAGATDRPHVDVKGVDASLTGQADERQFVQADRFSGVENASKPHNHGENSSQSIMAHTTAAKSSTAGMGAAQIEAAAASKEVQQDVVQQIVQRMTLHGNGRQPHMQIRLKPEFLGNLHMEVATENQQVMVRMTAETHAVKEMIEKNLHVLKAELQQHGLQIQKIDVQVSQDDNLWRNGQDPAAFGRHARGDDQGRGRPFQEGQEQGDSSPERRPSAADTTSAVGTVAGDVDFFA